MAARNVEDLERTAAAFEDFAKKTSMVGNTRVVMAKRSQTTGDLSGFAYFCRGKQLDPNFRMCLTCGYHIPEPNQVPTDAVDCIDTFVDAVCCDQPVDALRHDCRKCGKYFPSALELAQQAYLRQEYEAEMKANVSVLNACFYKFLKKRFGSMSFDLPQV